MQTQQVSGHRPMLLTAQELGLAILYNTRAKFGLVTAMYIKYQENTSYLHKLKKNSHYCSKWSRLRKKVQNNSNPNSSHVKKYKSQVKTEKRNGSSNLKLCKSLTINRTPWAVITRKALNFLQIAINMVSVVLLVS